MWYATERLATVPAAGGTPKILTSSLDRNVRAAEVFRRRDTIWFRLEDSGEEQIASTSANGGAITRHVSGPLAAGSFDVAGDTIALTGKQTRYAGRNFCYLRSNQLKQVTTLNKKLLDQISMAETENIQFKSKDGTEIEAFLYKTDRI